MFASLVTWLHFVLCIDAKNVFIVGSKQIKLVQKKGV